MEKQTVELHSLSKTLTKLLVVLYKYQCRIVYAIVCCSIDYSCVLSKATMWDYVFIYCFPI